MQRDYINTRCILHLELLRFVTSTASTTVRVPMSPQLRTPPMKDLLKHHGTMAPGNLRSILKWAHVGGDSGRFFAAC